MASELLEYIKGDDMRRYVYDKAGLNDDKYNAFIESMLTVCGYLVENGLVGDHVINSRYDASVMVFYILLSLAKDGYLSENSIGDAEKFYDYCKTYTEYEYSIPSNRKGGHYSIYFKCCDFAIKRIKNILDNGDE